jgi:hypothetical protein
MPVLLAPNHAELVTVEAAYNIRRMAKFHLRQSVRRIGLAEVRTVEEIREVPGVETL